MDGACDYLGGEDSKHFVKNDRCQLISGLCTPIGNSRIDTDLLTQADFSKNLVAPNDFVLDEKVESPFSCKTVDLAKIKLEIDKVTSRPS